MDSRLDFAKWKTIEFSRDVNLKIVRVGRLGGQLVVIVPRRYLHAYVRYYSKAELGRMNPGRVALSAITASRTYRLAELINRFLEPRLFVLQAVEQFTDC